MSMSPPPAYGPPSPYASSPSDSAFQESPRKRGLKRIIFGALGVLANLVGLVVMPLIAFVIVAVIATMSALAASLGGPSGSVEASSMSLYYVYVPTEDAGTADCSTSGGTDAALEESSGDGLTTTVDGTEYTAMGTFSGTGDQTIEVTCDGASDVAVADIGMTGTLVAGGIGVAIPVILGIIALILLIWGIVARVRSSRAVAEHQRAQSQYYPPQY
jgi:uncharacterized membrane protein